MIKGRKKSGRFFHDDDRALNFKRYKRNGTSLRKTYGDHALKMHEEQREAQSKLRKEMEDEVATQTTTKTQKYAAQVTGLPECRVVCRMKRMGGAFGGKETRSVFVSTGAALAASRCEFLFLLIFVFCLC